MDEKVKTWTLRFPAKENPNMEKALFDQLANRVAVWRQSDFYNGHEVFSPERSLNQPKPGTFVSVR